MNSNSQKTIIFLHIPKTAGRTLNNIIRRQYEPDVIFSNGRAVTSRLGSDWEKTPAELRWKISKEILAQLPELEKRKIKIVFGHMNFGRHELLPQPCTYITILRDPIDRIISHYYHILRMKEHHLYDIITTHKMSVGDFLKSGVTFTVDNGQTRMISGVGDSPGYGKCTSDILQTAKSNLEKHFSIVGLTGEFNKTLVLLKRTLNWNINSYQKRNVTQNRPSLKEISKKDRQIIEEYNQLDIELYEYAKQLFKDLVPHQDSSFEAEVKQLQDQNQS